jgi:hypothetical protein
MRLKPGDNLDIVLGSRIESFRADRSKDTSFGAFINNRDMKSLKIDEGSRILVQRKID